MEEGAQAGEHTCIAQESHNVILLMVEQPSKFHYLNKAKVYFPDSRALPASLHVASKGSQDVNIQATSEAEVAVGDFTARPGLRISSTHILEPGHQSHGHTQLRGILGNVAQQCGRQKRNML